MSHEKFWAENVLLNWEARTKFVDEIEKESKRISDELRSYLNENSNVGPVAVKYGRFGKISDARWEIEVGDVKISYTVNDIKNTIYEIENQNMYEDTDETSETVIVTALKDIIISKF